MAEKDLQVCKSNALVDASYRLSVAEQRIMLACIAQIRRDQQITDEVLYSVSATDIAELTGSTTNADYSELKKAALRLKRREVRIAYEPNGGGTPASCGCASIKTCCPISASSPSSSPVMRSLMSPR